MTTTEKRARNIENLRDLHKDLNNGDLSTFERHLTQFAIDHSAPPGMNNREGLPKLVKAITAKYPQFRIEIGDALYLADGDYVVAKIPLYNGDKEIAQMIEILRFNSEGKMVERFAHSTPTLEQLMSA